MKNLLSWILNLGYNVAAVEFAGVMSYYLVHEIDFPNPNGAMPTNFVSIKGLDITDMIQNNLATQSKENFLSQFKLFMDNITKENFVHIKFSSLTPFMFWSR